MNSLTAGCGCAGGKKGLVYVVTKPDGTKVTLNTLGEAQALVRQVGGTFAAKTAP